MVKIHFGPIKTSHVLCICAWNNHYLSRLCSDVLSATFLVMDCGRKERKCWRDPDSFGKIWNEQLWQQAAVHVSTKVWDFPCMSWSSDSLRGLIQNVQKTSARSDSPLLVFWNLQRRREGMNSWYLFSTNLLNPNGLSFSAVLTIVRSRAGLSSWKCNKFFNKHWNRKTSKTSWCNRE